MRILEPKPPQSKAESQSAGGPEGPLQFGSSPDVVKAFFIPGKSLHDELALLVRTGLSNAQALRAATTAPASYLGLRDSGNIAPGHRADLVLLDANLLEDISNTRKIAGVMANGAFQSRQAIDEMLRQVEREAAAWTGTPTGQ